MKLKLLAGAIAALTLTGASAASAATYLFTVDGCTGGCFGSGATSVGSVTTAPDGVNTVLVTVSLDKGYTFHDGGGSPHDVLAFDLPGFSSVTISNLASPLTANGSQTAASNFETGVFGDFDYALDFPKTSHPATISTFAFDVSALALSVASFASNKSGVYFTSDINGITGKTGNIGATVATGVPEPASWAIMLAGLGAVGAALRNDRRRRLSAA